VTITVDNESFELEADDLTVLQVLGRGAYGVVEKVKHTKSGKILAIKVSRISSNCFIKIFFLTA